MNIDENGQNKWYVSLIGSSMNENVDWNLFNYWFRCELEGKKRQRKGTNHIGYKKEGGGARLNLSLYGKAYHPFQNVFD